MSYRCAKPEAAICASAANAPFVRIANLFPLKMLRDGQMAGLIKLHRGDRQAIELQVWAGLASLPLERVFIRYSHHYCQYHDAQP